MKLNTKSLRTFFLVFIILFLLLQKIFLQNNNLQFLSYVDEIITILMFFFLLINFKYFSLEIKRNKISKNIFFLFVFSTVIGVISFLIYKKNSTKAFFIDFFSCSRFIIIYFFTKIYSKLFKIEFSTEKINTFLRILSYCLFALFILDIIFNIFPKFDVRFGIHSYQLFFIHPSQMSIFCIALISTLICGLNKNKKNIFPIIMLIIICLFSLRMASIAYLIIVLLMLILYKKNNNVSTKWITFFIIGVVAIYIGVDQFKYYYSSSNDGVRNVMTKDAINIALSNFPFGYGFGSFGTFAAMDYGSSVYSELHYYTKLYGFERFGCDSFIACIFGQFGLFGGISYIIILFSLEIKALKIIDKKKSIALIGLASYFLISMFASTDIFNPNFLPLIMIFALIENDDYLELNKKIYEKQVI